MARLEASPETTVLRLEPLSLDATATLCANRLGTVGADFVRACCDATGGNPFFLEALLREAAAKGLTGGGGGGAELVGRVAPTAVTEAVLLRLSGAPASAAALVRAVAVLGDGATLAETAAMAELGAEAAEVADQLVALDILRPGGRLEFAHPIVGEAVRADIGPRELAAAHARAARTLASSGATEERIAAQVVEADPIGDAGRVELLRRVAADALTRGAPCAAVAWLERASLEPPPPESRRDVLLELGSAELRLGASEGVTHLSQAVELSDDPEQMAIAVRRLAVALTLSGNAERAVAAIEAAVDLVEPGHGELALQLEGELLTHALQASLETRSRAARRVERHAGVDGSTPGERLVLASLACTRSRAAETARDAAAVLEGVLADGRFVADQNAGVVGLGLAYDLTIGLIAANALDVADAYVEELLVRPREQSAIPVLAYLAGRQGSVALRRGAVARAESDARTALELLTSHGIRLGVPYVLAVLVTALIEGGEGDLADRELRDRGFGQDIPPGPTSNFLLEARGLVQIAQGRLPHGVDDLLEFGRRDELWGIACPLASRWRSHAALALSTLGDRGRAQQMARDDLERARRWGVPSGIGVALRAVALTADREDQLVGLEEAVQVLAGSSARLEHARALTDLGAAHRRANRRTEARPALEQALALATQCSGNAVAGRARTELRAVGGRSSTPAATGWGALTASERRVAELAAEGQSNPEIAQALYVTRKTIETHLGHIYRKLGITSRARLARAMVGGIPTGDG